jgi:hypothetical protein
MLDDNTNALIRSANQALSSIAGSITSLDLTTSATLQLQRRFGWLLGFVATLTGVVTIGMVLAGVWMYQQNTALHAQTRAVVQANQTLTLEVLGRTPPRP